MSLRTMKLRTFRTNMMLSKRLVSIRNSLPFRHNTTKRLSLKSIEQEAILEALKRNGGNREMAARELGIGTRTLYRRLKEGKL